MMHTLNSPTLKVELNSTGAELSSITTKTGKEYIWQANPKWWVGRAPVLFPILCSMKNNAYTYKGKPYNMTKHGFVRSAEFTTTGVDGNKITFEYTQNEETLKMYPFNFLFQVIFELTNNTLSTTYRVENHNNHPMPFSFGSHEAYRCPHNENEVFEDYYIEFEKPGTYISETVEGVLLNGDVYSVIENDNVLPLHYGLFKHDTLIFKNVMSSKLSLKSKKSSTTIEIDYQNAPHLGIWTKPGAPYICIEPWFGLPDYKNHNGDIEKKDGIKIVEANESFAWTHTITINE